MKKKYIIVFILLVFSIFAIGDTVEISMENDLIGSTDRHYTHGTRISYSYPIESNLFPYKNALRMWAIGQYIYTPSNIKFPLMQVGDRPYGGWLYESMSISVYDDKTLDFLELSLGVTGKWSGASGTQKTIHKWLNATEPKGWGTQLDERIGINLTYIKKYKWKSDYFDFIVKGSTTVGNIHINGGVGALLRFGYNIPDDFGDIRMEPSSRNIVKRGFYGIVETSERYVGYNYFLQGDDAESVYGIHAEKFVNDLSIGCGAYYKNLDLIYLYNIRNGEFKEQSGCNEFGTIVLSWSY